VAKLKGPGFEPEFKRRKFDSNPGPLKGAPMIQTLLELTFSP